MFDWAKIILIALQILNKWMTWAQERKLINQGYDEAIAVQSRELFRKTEHAKKVMEEVNALSDDEVDAALVALEPDSGSAGASTGRPK